MITYRTLTTVGNLKNNFIVFFHHIKPRNQGLGYTVFLRKRKTKDGNRES